MKNIILISILIFTKYLAVSQYIYTGNRFHKEEVDISSINPLKGVVFDCSNKLYIEQLLNKKRITINSKFDNGETPLYFAFKCNDTLFLKNNNIDYTIVKNKGELLHEAIVKNNLKVVDYVLNHSLGFDINEPDMYGHTILYEIFSQTRDTSLINYLLKRGSCIDCGKFISYTVMKEGLEHDFEIPLDGAIQNSDTLIFNYAIELYRKNNLEKLFKERSLIETAITLVNFNRVSFFLDYFDKGSINNINSLGETLLTQSANSIAVSYSLLEFDEMEKNQKQKSLLIEGRKIIFTLLKNGADPYVPNKNGDTIFSLLKDIPIDIDLRKK
jgi:hypothetical protein